MTRFSHLQILFLAFVVPVLTPASVRADENVAPISLVSESAAVCLEVPHLEQAWSKLRRSELITRLKAFPPVERLISGAGFQKWLQVEQYARTATGKSLSDHLLGVFSESAVLAVYLPDDGPPQGVLITQARDEASLQQAIESWALLDFQQVTQPREHKGQTYNRRAKTATSSEVVYYVTFGRTFVLSDRETLVQQVIDNYMASRRRDSTNGTPGTSSFLGDSTLYRACRTKLPESGAAFLYVNARAWDKVLDKAVQQSSDAAPIRSLLRLVSAMGVSLRLDNEVVLDFVAELDNEARTSGWRQFVSAARPCDWVDRIPADTVLAISSRVDLRPAILAWLDLVPQTKTTEFARGRNAIRSALLGQDLFLDVLPSVLRNWTLTISRPANPGADPPIEAVARFSILSNGQQDSALEHGLDNALHLGLNLAAMYLSHQADEKSKPVLATSELTNGGLVRSLSGLRVFSPSYQLGPELLTIASTRAALTRTSDPKAGYTRLVSANRRYLSATSQLVWLDAARLREVVARHGQWISQQVTSGKGGDRIQWHLVRMGEVLKLFDAAFIAAQIEDDHVHVVCGATLDTAE